MFFNKYTAITGIAGVLFGTWFGHETQKQVTVAQSEKLQHTEEANKALKDELDLFKALESPPVDCVSTKAEFCKVTVYFATDRKRTGSWEPARYFSGDRNPSDRLTYGLCQVSIPAKHATGKLEEPLLWFEPNPVKDVVLMSIAVSTEDQFFSGLQSAVKGNSEEVLVFIHGYRVSFEEAARRAAQLTYDLQFKGIPILYSWPSRASLTGYPADEASASWTSEHLRSFLHDVARRSGAKTIHIIAHSLGNRALITALQEIAAERDPHLKKFHQIILAAPDIDAGVFEHLVSVFPSAADHVTIYSSSNDLALRASASLHRSPAAGSVADLPSQIRSSVIEFIDASVMGADLLDHSYYAGNIAVLEDMGYLIREDLPANRRMLLEPKPDRAAPKYWAFRR